MANTTLQIRHSTVAGNTPSSLANGEIAINSRDGILFYSTPSGVVTSFTTGPSGLNTEIQFNDGGSVGGSEKLTFNKTTGQLTVNGTVRANLFSDDGTDLYDFSNRAFTTANAAFTAANNATDTYVRNHANSAFIQANASFTTANLAFTTANASYNVLMIAYETQGTGACTTFNMGFKPYTANSIFVSVDGVIQSDTTYSVDSAANTITFVEAPASYESVRIVGFKQINPYIIENNSIDFPKLQSSVSATINASFNQANSAFTTANSAASTGKAIAMSIVFGG